LRLDKFAQVTDEKPAEEKPTESKQREVADGSVSQDFVLRFAAILRADNVGCNSLVNTASFMAR
jgi:cell division septation protein DedD